METNSWFTRKQKGFISGPSMWKDNRFNFEKRRLARRICLWDHKEEQKTSLWWSRL